MPRVELYNSKTWRPEKATYKLGSGIIASVLSTIALIFLGLQGAVGQPQNLGLAVSAILLILIGLFASFARPKVDDLYKVAPRPPLENRIVPVIIIFAFVYLAFGLLNQVVINKELSFLSADSTVQQIGILAGSGVSENLFILFLLFSSLFNALLATIGNYWFSLTVALLLSTALGWINHFFVYGLDPGFFIFVAGSFAGMGILYWVKGSVMLTIVAHVWWNIGGIVWQSLGLAAVKVPGLNCVPYCSSSIVQPSLLLPLLPGLALILALFPLVQKLGGNIGPVTGGIS